MIKFRPKMIKVNKGVKQGGPFSPQGWAWLVNEMIIELLNSGTIYERGQLKALMLYADDTASGHETIEQAQRALDIVSAFCKRNEIKINETKTVWMKLGEKPNKDRDGNPIAQVGGPNEKLLINGVELQKVAIFKYLGAHIASDNKNGYHLEARTKAAWGGIGELKKIGFYNENLKPKVKGLLLQTYFRSRLLYAAESLDLTQNSISELVKMEKKMIRKSFSLSSKAKTDEIYFAMGTKQLKEAIEKRDLTFLIQLLNNKATARVVISTKTSSKHTRILNEVGFKYDWQETIEYNIIAATSKCVTKLNQDLKLQKDKKPTALARAVESLLESGNHEDRTTVKLLLNYENRFRIR